MTDADAPSPLPDRFHAWFARRGWTPRAHQLALIRNLSAGRSTLLIAPTGAGKTLAGFLPSLIEIAGSTRAKPGQARSGTRARETGQESSGSGVHTLYISPLKALAVDIARNLEMPVAEMGLDIRIETRTGDTPTHKRQRQKTAPPDILLTTPEQIALLLSDPGGMAMLSGVRTVILDELHALVTSKRGDLLALGLARLRRLSPGLRMIGLSATVAEPDDLRAFLSPQDDPGERRLCDLVTVTGGAAPDVSILQSDERVPWSGHSARYALSEVYALVKAHRVTLIFVNTRSQAETVFQDLWKINEDTLPIALHHGSLDVAQRRKVEAAMAAGQLRAIVATSSLDMGIDWGDIDLVINIGAPKGASRLAQRIGRANHRMDEPSKAVLVPANRFEVLECRAALEASVSGGQDTPRLRRGALDVLAQHVLGMACAEPFHPDALFAEITASQTYRHLDRATFDRIVDFVATGGYALRSYDRYAKLKQGPDGLFRIANPKIAQQYRLNVGTIVEAPMLKVRQVRSKAEGRKTPLGRGGRVLGEIEEWFVEQLTPGDTFLFAGEVLRFEAILENEAYVSRARSQNPMIPSYQGGKFPLSTYLADGVRRLIAEPARWPHLPDQVQEWLELQRVKSVLPRHDGLLVETFPRADKHYLVCYPFEGRLAHQTLGMLLTRRLERLGARPMGFVANDYALSIWGLGDLSLMIRSGRIPLDGLFEEDLLGDDLDAWLAESHLMKRTFRYCAVIAGLIERRHPGQEKNGRQITVSSDLIYDVLRQHEPDHILLKATWNDAAEGLLDISRLGELLARIRGRITHTPLDRVSPLAVPVLLEIGREPVYGEAQDAILAEAADDLIGEALA
ncbi:ligase-associated DNA damage response DEXH box helicase [Pannonibacter tanglangensis]|uniref:Ligase-associated DNA damage response DEXH box helicase n=1 Tax=Pannonibacter tanglangensis TaxID=2750084 RepID=A0ABW9ZJZ8_9HYPH|nr:ligase-associated DNA damage response DEXH box helicase [Pannonibacter sp. XCT-34]NBN64267.1 ligase-associated DNA damage response DEXH box helicase [Pannonibacter sp. XCT-34]